MSRAAEVAVRDVDVTLDLADPSSREADEPALTLSRTDDARMALRQKREGSKVPTSGALTSQPTVETLAFAIRYLPGGRKRFLELVKMAAMNGDAASSAWWTVYADLTPTQRSRAGLDDILTAAGVKPSTLLAGIVGHGLEAAVDMGNLIAAVFHPQVVAAAGRSALRIDGEHADIAAEDRRQLLQARGMLPVPKGTSIHLHANASANSQASAAASADPSVPNFSQDMEALTGQVIDVVPEAKG